MKLLSIALGLSTFVTSIVAQSCRQYGTLIDPDAIDAIGTSEYNPNYRGFDNCKAWLTATNARDWTYNVGYYRGSIFGVSRNEPRECTILLEYYLKPLPTLAEVVNLSATDEYAWYDIGCAGE